MSEEEIEVIRIQFRNTLNKLIESKIRPTGTTIISVEQPMVQLFEELIYKIDKLQKENEELKEQNVEMLDYLEELNTRIVKLQKENKELFEEKELYRKLYNEVLGLRSDIE